MEKLGQDRNRANEQKNRSYVEWVNIEEIIPNPLNPRKNDALKTEELQAVIKKRGWEIPITAYQKGRMYVVLSGHRRLFAARQANMKQIPVFVVDAPKTHQEEIERIASAQAHQEDWDVYEWARFTYERWLAWGKPNFTKFSKLIGMPKRTVETYCQVLDYFPNDEIEAGLKNKTFSIHTLYLVYTWMRDLKEHHKWLIEQLSEELIRRSFLKKVENKKAASDLLKKRQFLMNANDKDLKEFFMQPELTLEEIMIRGEFDANEKTFQGRMISVGYAKKNIKNITPKSKKEAKTAAENLLELQKSIAAQLKEIERKYPDAIDKKDELWDWN